jgi:hypothetical protein
MVVTIMEVAELFQYLDQMNQVNRLFNRPDYDLNRRQDRSRIASKVEADLSPENLTMDGELPRDEVNRRLKFLTLVQKQLELVEQHEAIHEAIDLQQKLRRQSGG